MGISPTTKSMAAAAARKSSAFGPPRPPATTAAAGGAAGRRGDRDAVPLGNPQFQATWEENGDSHAFRVRGPGYLSGGGKVDAGSPFGKLVRADLFKVRRVSGFDGRRRSAGGEGIGGFSGHCFVSEAGGGPRAECLEQVARGGDRALVKKWRPNEIGFGETE